MRCFSSSARSAWLMLARALPRRAHCEYMPPSACAKTARQRSPHAALLPNQYVFVPLHTALPPSAPCSEKSMGFPWPHGLPSPHRTQLSDALFRLRLALYIAVAYHRNGHYLWPALCLPIRRTSIALFSRSSMHGQRRRPRILRHFWQMRRSHSGLQKPHPCFNRYRHFNSTHHCLNDTPRQRKILHQRAPIPVSYDFYSWAAHVDIQHYDAPVFSVLDTFGRLRHGLRIAAKICAASGGSSGWICKKLCALCAHQISLCAYHFRI